MFFDFRLNKVPKSKKKRRRKPSHYIYVLKLENDKWYVGLTINHKRRIAEHFGETHKYPPAKWTKIFKPVAVENVIKVDCSKISPEDWERIYTILYMRKYGAHNVRGADWCQTACPIDLHSVRLYANNNRSKIDSVSI